MVFDVISINAPFYTNNEKQKKAPTNQLYSPWKKYYPDSKNSEYFKKETSFAGLKHFQKTS